MEIYFQIEQEIKNKKIIFIYIKIWLLNPFIFIFDTLLFQIIFYRIKNTFMSE